MNLEQTSYKQRSRKSKYDWKQNRCQGLTARGRSRAKKKSIEVRKSTLTYSLKDINICIWRNLFELFKRYIRYIQISTIRCNHLYRQYLVSCFETKSTMPLIVKGTQRTKHKSSHKDLDVYQSYQSKLYIWTKKLVMWALDFWSRVSGALECRNWVGWTGWIEFCGVVNCTLESRIIVYTRNLYL